MSQQLFLLAVYATICSNITPAQTEVAITELRRLGRLTAYVQDRFSEAANADARVLWLSRFNALSCKMSLLLNRCRQLANEMDDFYDEPDTPNWMCTFFVEDWELGPDFIEWVLEQMRMYGERVRRLM